MKIRCYDRNMPSGLTSTLIYLREKGKDIRCLGEGEQFDGDVLVVNPTYHQSEDWEKVRDLCGKSLGAGKRAFILLPSFIEEETTREQLAGLKGLKYFVGVDCTSRFVKALEGGLGK